MRGVGRLGRVRHRRPRRGRGRRARPTQPIGLDDSGAVRRIDMAEVIGRIGRDGVAAIGTGFRIVAYGHTACITSNLIAVIISFHWTRSEAHGRLPSFVHRLAGLPHACLRYARPAASYMIIRTLFRFRLAT